jgi:hypothetical protein
MTIIMVITSDAWILGFIARPRLVDSQVLPGSGRKLEETA